MDDHYNLRGNTKAYTAKMGISHSTKAKGFRLKFRKAGNNWFEASMYRRSNGSLIQSRTGPFWFAFKVFLSPKNYWRALTW